MSFISSVLLLATIVSTIFIAIFVGNGLAESDPKKFMVSLIFAVSAVVLGFLYTRVARLVASRSSETNS